MTELSPAEVLRIRQWRQLLHRPGWASPQDVVQRLVGVQAQDLEAARLAIVVRSSHSTPVHVETARVDERSIVRTWAMRATLHLVAASDLSWLRPLLTPRIVEITARRSRELGLDEKTYTAALESMRRALQTGPPLSRHELASRLESEGIDPSGQRMPYLLLRASIEGLICEGPLLAGKPAYVLVSEWLERAPSEDLDREEALLRLATRYLAGYGPASPADFSAWSGFPLREARAAFQGAGAIGIKTGDSTLWDLNERSGYGAEVPRAALLPAFDAYLLGYRDRSLFLDGRFVKKVNAGGGMVRPVFVVDGRIQGTWRLSGSKVAIEPFEELAPELLRILEEQAQRIRRLLSSDTKLPDAGR